MAPPNEVDWSKLSPAGLEVVARIVLRPSADFDNSEVARLCEREREEFRHLAVPERPISNSCSGAAARAVEGVPAHDLQPVRGDRDSALTVRPVSVPAI